MTELIHKELTGKILRSYYNVYNGLSLKITRAIRQVHRILGPGFVNRIYANACYYELQKADLSLERRKGMEVMYKHEQVGRIGSRHFIVDGLAMVFPMAIASIDYVKYFNIQAYIRRQNIKFAIVVNFNSTELEIKYITV